MDDSTFTDETLAEPPRHRRGLRSLAAGSFLPLVAAAAAAALAQSYQTRSVRDGVFSGEQVERGRATFEWICTDCHEVGEFTDAGAYLEEMDGEAVWEIYEYVSAEMPEDDPGWLEPAEYAEVLAYLLSAYGMPAGDEELPTDRAALEAIVVERPGGR
jgi:mono/diheme cytochrome c family protein